MKTETTFEIHGRTSNEGAFAKAREHVDSLGDWQDPDDPWKTAYNVEITLLKITNTYCKGGYGGDNADLVFHFKAEVS